MLYREIIAVCSQIHTKHINTLCGQNGELNLVAYKVTTGLWRVEEIQVSGRPIEGMRSSGFHSVNGETTKSAGAKIIWSLKNMGDVGYGCGES